MFYNKNKLFRKNTTFRFGNKIMKAISVFISSLIHTRLFNINSSRCPMFITWLCTYNCNAYCKFCSTHRIKKRFPDVLSRERALEVAHEIGKSGTVAVGFTGGEVLLYPYLFEVIRILKEYGVIIYILTNGLTLKENTESILDTGVDTIVVSVDSIVPQEHDMLKGKPGIYNALIEGIEYIKKKRVNNKPIIKTTTVLSKQNYTKIKDIIDYLSKIADVNSIQPISTGFANGVLNIPEKEKDSFLFSLKDELDFQKHLNNLIKHHHSFNTSYFKNISTFLFRPERLLKIRCWSPFLRLQIQPNGEVFHCVINPRFGSVGNLNNMSLIDVWNSSEMMRQREVIRRHQNRCICWCQDTSFNIFLDSIPLINKLPVFMRQKIR